MAEFLPRVPKPFYDWPRRANGGVATRRQHEPVRVGPQPAKQILNVAPYLVGTLKFFRLHGANAAGDEEPVTGQLHDLVQLHVAERRERHAFEAVHSQQIHQLQIDPLPAAGMDKEGAAVFMRDAARLFVK